MRRSRRPIVIASRRSALACAQAQAAGAALGRLFPNVDVTYRWIESEGDRKTDAPLAAEGGKGLFTGAVEDALLSEEADLAIHSLKDLPARDTRGLTLAAIPRRGDVRDALIALEADSIDQLPHAAVVGTSSPRRAAQLLRIRPDLRIEPFRGNVDTRLRKVFEDRVVDATLLAMAGLHRSGFRQHATKPIDPTVVLPAAGQGALAVQCRTDDHVTISRCLPLNHLASSAATHLERMVIAALGADCHSAVAVLAQPDTDDPDSLTVRARVFSPDGRSCIECDGRDHAGELAKLGRRIVTELRARGAENLLRTAAPEPAPAR